MNDKVEKASVGQGGFEMEQVNYTQTVDVKGFFADSRDRKTIISEIYQYPASDEEKRCFKYSEAVIAIDTEKGEIKISMHDGFNIDKVVKQDVYNYLSDDESGRKPKAKFYLDVSHTYQIKTRYYKTGSDLVGEVTITIDGDLGRITIVKDGIDVKTTQLITY